MRNEPEGRVGGAATTPEPGDDHDRAAQARHRARVRRTRIAVAVWAIGTLLLTIVFVQHEWSANGAFRHIGNAGNPGDWNPTLWAVLVGALSMIAGTMALQTRLERPVAPAEVDREVRRLAAAGPGHGEGSPELRDVARTRLERRRRLRFHAAAWVLGLVLLTPVWLLIEWQDNGPFERWSSDSRPGSWDPWILPVCGIWLLVIAALALRVHLTRPPGNRAASPPDDRPGTHA